MQQALGNQAVSGSHHHLLAVKEPGIRCSQSLLHCQSDCLFDHGLCLISRELSASRCHAPEVTSQHKGWAEVKQPQADRNTQGTWRNMPTSNILRRLTLSTQLVSPNLSIPDQQTNFGSIRIKCGLRTYYHLSEQHKLYYYGSIHINCGSTTYQLRNGVSIPDPHNFGATHINSGSIRINILSIPDQPFIYNITIDSGFRTILFLMCG